MRIIVQDATGYVTLDRRRGSGVNGDYYHRTQDAVDAHDFELPSKAREWIARKSPGAQIHELNDDGSWPLEEPA